MNSPELWASMEVISTARLAITRGVCSTTSPLAASAGRVASIRALKSAYFCHSRDWLRSWLWFEIRCWLLPGPPLLCRSFLSVEVPFTHPFSAELCAALEVSV
jgi:hypothetical protein